MSETTEVPLTLFAHQVPALGLKMARPKWFDGTALCIGSMAPDLAYSVSGSLGVDTHDWDGFVAIDLPLAIVVTIVIRWSTASVAAAQLPDLGGFRLWSWRVVARRRPKWWLTIMSCAIGALTHVGVDSLTHPGRAGVRLLGYDDVVLQLWGRAEPLTGVLQLIGHTFGSMLGLWLLLMIGKHYLLEQWYGVAAVDQARHFQLATSGRIVFWALTVMGAAGGAWWGWNGDIVERVQRPLVAAMTGAMIAALLPACRPRAAASPVPPRHVPHEPRPR
ncbi:MAG: DUF4184 family protein [Ilumatobacteraceae bacterium]